MEDEKEALAQKLIDDVNEISAIKDYRPTVRKQYYNLARRLKLLTPMFEEIRDSKEPLDQESQSALATLKSALDSAIEMLRFGSEGSKIYIVIEEVKLTKRFQDITNELEQALSAIPYEVFDMSDEVKEQVDLVLGQFRRAKGRVEPPDSEIYEDLVTLNNQPNDSTGDPDALRRLLEKLQLTQISDLTQESLALLEMVAVTGGDSDDNIEKMSMTLKKIKDFVLTEIPEMDAVQEPSEASSCSAQTSNAEGNPKAIVIPDDFRCPISLELMKDPVIVSTGQTYERASIEKWLEAGHVTCPKTQQALTSTTLTPNYVLRSLIPQWCEANGIEPPKRPSSSRPKRTSACSPAERTIIDNLLRKLNSGNHEDLLSAAGEIRLLAKRNADNRVAIAEAGAIPLLVNLLSTPDSRIQEHAVTALLNLSICEDNKGIIISSGALPGIVHVLKKGSMEARENAATTLFSLSVMNGNANKITITIGSSGAIPPLVTLLNEGTQRGKKDAATALFNLCIYLGNKGKAVRAGVVPTLMRLLTQPQDGMVDEALAILTILARHPQGKLAIGAAKAVPILVEAIENGSPRNKENAAAVLVHLCSGDQQHLLEAKELGVMVPLLVLAQNGTERGKRKAVQLLERMNRFLEQQKQLEGQAADVSHTHQHQQHHHLAQLLQLPSLDTDLDN